MLGRIAAQADGLLRLTRELLENEDLDDMNVVRVTVDVSALVTEAVAAMRTGEHPVTVDAPPTVSSVEPVRVRRIVENLVANAFHHTPQGTPVWVRVRRDASGVLVSVDDAGPGVPPDRREQIFEAFRRGESSTGSGLGLSLVARFAADHGGRAWVEERPGGGASFKVLLRAP
jgi:signal transduction histidine kinase